MTADRSVVGDSVVWFMNALTHLPPDDLPERFGELCGRLGARDVTIHLVDLDQNFLNPLGSGGEPMPVESSTAGEAYRREQVLTVDLDDASSRAWIPIIDSAERLGILGVSLEQVDVELWAAVGSLLGECVMSKDAYGDLISRTRRTKHVSIAAELRWSLLPPLTFTGPRVEVSGIFEPAYDIAGDTFDYSIDGDIARLAVFDAMGHGIEASRMANLAVAAYRNSRRKSASLEETARSIDRTVAEEFGDHRFVTGQLAELDMASGMLSVVNAGHPPPLHFRSGRHVGDVPCVPCLPMGLGPERIEVVRRQLEPGDVTIFHTDGATEARSAAGEDFGTERVVGAVTRFLADGLRPAEVLRQVVRAVYDHSAEPLRDDASLIFLRWLGA